MSINENGKFQFEKDDIKKVVILSFATFVVTILVAIILGYISIEKKTEYNIEYKNQSKVDYNVYLKENEYYREKFLPKDSQYISSLIDYVDILFDYNFEEQNKETTENFEYSYYVTASVLVNNLQEKNIYNSENVIVEKKAFQNIENDKFNIRENVKIKYDDYNNFTSKFIEDYKINGDAFVEVKLYVDVMGESKELFSKKEVATVKIPLTSKKSDIDITEKTVNNKLDTITYESTNVGNRGLFIFAVLLVIAACLLAVAVVIYVYKNLDYHVLYARKLRKIMRDYDRYITETEANKSIDSLLKTVSMRVEVVKKFDDLINVRDSVEKPILYHEDKKREETIFYIIDAKTTYIYILSATSFKKDGGKNEK